MAKFLDSANSIKREAGRRKKKQETPQPKQTTQSPSVSQNTQNVVNRMTQKYGGGTSGGSYGTRSSGNQTSSQRQNQRTYGQPEQPMRRNQAELQRQAAERRSRDSFEQDRSRVSQSRNSRMLDTARGTKPESITEYRAKQEAARRQRSGENNRVSRSAQRTANRALRNTPGVAKESLRQAVIGHGKTAADLTAATNSANLGYRADIKSRQFQEDIERRRGSSTRTAQNAYRNLSRQQERSEQRMQNLTKNAKGLEKAYYGALESGIGMATDALIGAGTGQAGALTAMASRTYGATRGQAQKEGATESEDRLYSLAQGLKESGTELMFPGAGLAKRAYGRAGLSLAEKGANLLTRRLRGKTADIAHAGLKLAGGVGEENLEEIAGWGLDPLIKEFTYGRKTRQRDAKEVMERISSDLRSNIKSDEDAQSATAYLSSPDFLEETKRSYIQEGMSESEAAEIAAKMRDYLAAGLSGDTEAMVALEDEVSKRIAKSKKLEWDTKELRDTIASTTLLTGVTGLPGTLTTTARGAGIRDALGDDGVRALANTAIDFEDDDLSYKGQAARDRIDSGKGLTATQVYDLAAGQAQQYAVDRERAATSRATASKALKDNDLVSPFSEDQDGNITDIGEATGRAYNEAADSAVRAIRNVAEENGKGSLTNTELDKGRRAIAGFKTGVFTIDDANELNFSNGVVREAFKAETGIDLDQYIVTDKKGNVNISATNTATKNALFAMAADNLVQSAQAETVNWMDTAKGEVVTQVSRRMGSKGTLALQQALDDVDERDRASYMMTANAADMLYQTARNMGTEWSDVRETASRMFRNIPEDKLKAMYEAGLDDRLMAMDDARGQQIQIGEKVKLAKNNDAPMGQVLVETETPVKGTVLRTFSELADNLGVDIHLVDDLSTGTGNQANGQYINGNIYINVNSDFEQNMGYIFMHEVTHHLKLYAPEQYKDLENLVREKWFNYDASQMQSEIAKIIDLYERNGQKLTEDEALEEIIADAAHEFINDPNFARTVADENPSLAKAILNSIRNALRMLRRVLASGSIEDDTHMNSLFSQIGILDEAERLWLDAYTKAAANKAAVGVEDLQNRIYEEGRESGNEYEGERFSIVTDPETIKKLEADSHINTYRAMALIDGKLYPPMASKVKDDKGKWVLQQGMELGQWVESDITTDPAMFDNKGRFLLRKDIDGTTVPAAYNPYIHSSDSMLNDQFAIAYRRPNMVVVEGEIPESELTSGYRAEHDLDDGRHVVAKDTTGITDWKAGIVQGQLSGKRTVYLTQHFKPTRIVPDSEVAQHINDKVAGTGVVIPYNVVTPSVREELQKLGTEMAQSKEAKYYVEDAERYSINDDYTIQDGDARWTDDRIDYIIRDNGEKFTNKTHAWAAMINPRDFLKLTLDDRYLDRWNEAAQNVPEEVKGMSYAEADEYVYQKFRETGEWIHDNENYPLDEEELRGERTTPFLKILQVGNSVNVDGHEGRHRMRALMEAGIKSVPVLITTNGRNEKSNIDSLTLRSQEYGFPGPVNNGATVKVSDLVPVTENNRDELIQKFGGEAQVRFSISEMPSIDELDQTNSAVEDENGDMVAQFQEDGSVKFSISSFENSGRKIYTEYLEKQVKNGNLSRKEADDMLHELETVYGIAKEYADSGKYAPYTAWSYADVVTGENGKPVFSAIKKNSEYKMNIDFSTICKKRRTLDAVFREMINRGMFEKLDLNKDESAAMVVNINNLIRQHKFEAACALCFVEARRYRQQQTATTFRDMWNGLVESMYTGTNKAAYFNYGEDSTVEDVPNAIHTLDDSELDLTYLKKIANEKDDKGKKKQTAEAKAARLILSDPSQRKLMRVGDMMASTGFENMQVKNPELMKVYNSKKGTGGAKSSFGDVQYLNEILKPRSFGRKAAYAVSGVRIQSFSDYVPRMVFDYVQVIADLAAKHLPAHGYTKEPLFVYQFGLTGTKINMSLVPDVVADGEAPGLDKDGNYIWNEEGTFPYDVAMEVQKADGYKENCGTIAVGISDKQIMKMLADPTIQMVIPYHKSSLNPIVAAMTNVDRFENYEKFQTTKDENGNAVSKDFEWDKKLFRLSHDSKDKLLPRDQWGNVQDLVKEYADWCKSKNYTPKFEKFLYLDKEKTQINPGYYKLLEDFALLDNDGNFKPQDDVKMRFPTESDAFGSMKNLIAQGLSEDTELEEKRSNEIGEIVDEIDEMFNQGTLTEQSVTSEKLAARMSISEELDKPYMDAVNSGNMDAAQRLVDEAAKTAGFKPVHRYHGTMNAGFTVFDKAYAKVGGNSGAGFYFSTEKDDSANHYADVEGADNYFKWSELADRIHDAVSEGTWEGAPELGVESDDIETYEDAVDVAKRILNKNPGTFDVYLNYHNPYIRDGANSTNLYDMLTDEFDESTIDRADYEDDWEYDDAVWEARSEHVGEAIYSAVYGAYQDMENNYEILDMPTIDEVIRRISEYAFDGSLTWKEIEDAIISAGDVEVTNPNWTDSGYATPEFTRAIIENLGFDAIEDKEVSKKFGQLSREMMTDTEHIIVFKPEQIKLSDPITYAEDGSVIPLSERFDPSNNDIRYSLPTQDSDGNILTDGQMEYFKNSQARDEQGRLVPVYHTTRTGGFTIFDPQKSDDHRSLFFTNDRDMSASYSKQEGAVPEVINPYDGVLPKRTTSDVATLPDFGDVDVKTEDVISSISNINVMNRAGKVIASGDDFVKVAQDVGRYLENDGYDLLDDLGVDPALLDDEDWGGDTGDAWELYNSMINAGLRYTMDYGDPIVTYSCYLNIEHPLIIEGNDQEWDAISMDTKLPKDCHLELYTSEYLLDTAKYHDYLYEIGQRRENGSKEKKHGKKAKKNGTVVLKFETGEWIHVKENVDAISKAINEHYGIEGSDPTGTILAESFLNDIQKKGRERYQKWRNESLMKEMTSETHNTREWAEIAYDQGYDGVIFRDIVDYGDSNYGWDAHDVYIAFSSNQVKDTRNENPSENADIRYSIPDEDEVIEYLTETADNMDDMFYTDPILEEGRRRLGKAKADFIFSKSNKWNERWLTEGLVLDEKKTKRAVREAVMNVMSKAEGEAKYKSELVDEAMKTCKKAFYLMKIGKFSEAGEIIYDLSRDMVENNNFFDDAYEETFNNYVELRNYIRARKFYVPDLGAQEYAEHRRMDMGKIWLCSERKGTSIDEEWPDLCKNFPQWFSIDEAKPTEMLFAMENALTAAEPVAKAYCSEEAADYIDSLASQLYDIVYEGEEYKSIADVYKASAEQKTAAMKQRFVEAMRSLQTANEEHRAEIKELKARNRQNLKTQKMKYEYEIAELKQNREYNIQRLKAEKARAVKEERQKNRERRAEERSNRVHRELLNRITDRYNTLCKWVLDPTKEQNVPEEFRVALAEFLQTLDLQTYNSKALEEKTGHVAYKTFRMRELKDRLNALAESKTDVDGNYSPGIFEVDAYVGYLMESLSNKLDGKPVDALDNEAVKDIDTIMKSIIRNIQRYKEVKLETRNAELSDIGSRAAEFFINKRNRDGLYGKHKGALGALETINATALTPAYLFDRMGPFKEMYDALRHNGFDTYIRNEQMITEKLREILSPYYNANKSDKKRKRPVPGSEIEKWRDDRSAQTIELSDGNTVTMTAAQMMSLYCLSKRGDQALGHMCVGGILVTPIQTGSKIEAAKERIKRKADTSEKRVLARSDVDAIIAKLTPDQKKVADQLQELMSVDMAKLGNEAHRELYGYDMFNESNYFPIKVHGNERATDINTIGEVFERIKSFGFTKPLTPQANKAIEIDDIFSVVADHCNGMNLYNAYLVPITDFMKVLNYTHTAENGEVITMKEAIVQVYGKDILKYILNMMKDINGIRADNRGGLEGIMNSALGTAKKTAVFGNIRVALQQPTAIVRAFAEVNPKYFMPLTDVKLADMSVYDEMYKYCPIAQWKNWGYYDTYMGRDIEDVMMNNYSMSDVALSGLYGALDNMTWSAIWQAVKSEQMDLHEEMDYNSEEFLKLCGRRASEVFDKTQVVDSTFHRSDAMRSKQVATKAFTAFMAEPTLTLNVFRAGLYNFREEMKAGNKGKAYKILGTTLGVIAAQAAIVSAAQAVADAWRGKDPGLPWGDDDDDDKDKEVTYGERFYHNLVQNIFNQLHLENNMYLVKDVTPYINYMISKGADYWNWDPTLRAIMGWDQDYLYSQNNLIFAGLENTANGIEQVFKKLQKGDDYVDYKTKEPKKWYDIIQKTMSGVGTFTGIPIGTLMRDFHPIWDKLFEGAFAMDEEEEPKTSKLLDSDSGSAFSGDTEAGSSEGTSSTESSSGTYSKEKPFFGLGKSEYEKHQEEEQKKIEAAEKKRYDKVDSIREKTADLEGLEKDRKVWSAVTKYMKDEEHNGRSIKEYIAEGDFYTIDELKTMYIQAGGDTDYFNERMIANCKSELKKTISSDNTEEQVQAQQKIKEYMLNSGVTEAELSEIAYNSRTKTELKVAFRINDHDAIVDEMTALFEAGITEEDIYRIYDNRNKGLDLKKYKESGGKYADRLKSTGVYNWPINGSITSRFGPRSSPGGVGSTYHQGLDIAGSMGDPIAASDGGTVVYVGWYGGAGKTVMIEHDDGTVTQYSHMSWYDAKEGDIVAQGQYIGRVGSTGNSTGPHLHFAVKVNGSYTDPLQYLSKNS